MAAFKMLHSVPEGDHNDCFMKGNGEYIDIHRKFFARCEGLHAESTDDKFQGGSAE